MIEFINVVNIRIILRLVNFFNLKNIKDANIFPKEEYKKNSPN